MTRVNRFNKLAIAVAAAIVLAITGYQLYTQVAKKDAEVGASQLAEQIAELCRSTGAASEELRSAGACYKAEVIKVQGPQGIQGEVGPEGPPGKDGVDGTDGVDGVDGTDGVDGVSGVDGVRGADGVDGTKGERGAKGDKGDKGEKGDTGPKGDKGDQGPPGPPGTPGADGVDGRTPITVSCPVLPLDSENGYVKCTVTEWK